MSELAGTVEASTVESEPRGARDTTTVAMAASAAAPVLVEVAIPWVLGVWGVGSAVMAGLQLLRIVRFRRRLRAWRLAEGETDTLRVNVSRGFLDLGKGRL